MSPSKRSRVYYWTDSLNVSTSHLTLTLTLTLLSSGFRWVGARFQTKPTGFQLGFGA